jgi:VanZ family protein
MTERGRARLYGVLALAWAAFIFWESSKADPFPFVPQGILSHDKLLHFGAYAVLGGLLAGALSRTRLGTAPRAAAVALLLASAYGASDELHQSFVPGRDSDPWDWAADTLGAVAGAAAMAVTLRRRDLRASIRA